MITDAQYQLHEALLKVERRARATATAADGPGLGPAVQALAELRAALHELDELRDEIRADQLDEAQRREAERERAEQGR